MFNAFLEPLNAVYHANQRLLWKQSIGEHELGLHMVFAGCPRGPCFVDGILNLSHVCPILPGQLQICQNRQNMLANGNMARNSENDVNER